MPFLLDINSTLYDLLPSSTVNVRITAQRVWRFQIIITDDDVSAGSCLSIQPLSTYIKEQFFQKNDGIRETVLMFVIKTKDAGFSEGIHLFSFWWDGQQIGSLRIEAIAPASVILPGHLVRPMGQKDIPREERIIPQPVVRKKDLTGLITNGLMAVMLTTLLIILSCAGVGIYSAIKLTEVTTEGIRSLFHQDDP